MYMPSWISNTRRPQRYRKFQCNGEGENPNHHLDGMIIWEYNYYFIFFDNYILLLYYLYRVDGGVERGGRG